MTSKIAPKLSVAGKPLKRPLMLLLLLLIFALSSCTNNEKKRAVDLPNGKRAIFLNLNQSKAAIIKDEVEHYFDQVSYTDIAIQTKIALPDSAKRGKVMTDFKSALQEDVLEFTREDKDFLVPILKELSKLIGQVSKDFLDTDIKLIKIGGRYYGPSIFYTRENCIIIPKYELQKRDKKVMKSILAHELFHIYSRYHPEKRTALYEMIGFRPLGITKDQLEMPESLSNSILLNPDGIDFLYSIRLEVEGKEVDCIVLTSSNFHQFTAGKKSFFPYLSANFYPIEAKADGGYKVITTESGSSPLDFRTITESLFEQIGNNTYYIIHPDEILADNFAILIASTLEELKKAQENDQFKLLEKMPSIIKGED